MGCNNSSLQSRKYKNDKKWENLANWGKGLGLKTWSDSIACMDSIHPKLYMGSRLSAQKVIDKQTLIDQHRNRIKGSRFNLVCVASQNTCAYCELSRHYKSYDIQDRSNQNDNFLHVAKKTARHIHGKLKYGSMVLVHCHSGRNRSALAILVYCGMYTNMSYEDALHKIRHDNISRFSTQSTLQNDQFTSTVRNNWQNLKR
jgi:hypothetical protein